MYSEITLMPRFCDTDLGGHINNTAIPEWLESGRVDMLFRRLPETPPTMMIRHISVDYLRELNHLQEAIIRTGVETLSNKTVTYRQEIWQDGVLRVTAKAVDCFFDPDTRRAAPIPERFRNAYKKVWFDDNELPADDA